MWIYDMNKGTSYRIWTWEYRITSTGSWRIPHKDCHKLHEPSGPTTPGSLQVGVALTFYTCIRKVLSSNLDRDTILICLTCFSSVPRRKFRESISIRPQLLPFKSFPSINHQSSCHLTEHTKDISHYFSRYAAIYRPRGHDYASCSITFCTPSIRQFQYCGLPAARDHIPITTRSLMVL
jgi:hypothetical protein